MATKKPDKSGQKVFTIEIDGTQYEWSDEKITGAQLRQLPSPPIPSDHEIYLGTTANPGHRIKDDDTIVVHDGLRVFTKPKLFTIRIDRIEYEWGDEKITGAQLRLLPQNPIPPNRDLYQVIPGDSDRLIEGDDTIEVHDGLRFFTAPSTINPGCIRSEH